ncbi:MAG: hypothetical protein M3Y81_02620 [Chloroflexota bacterium]|nr:hypothetical protein [Chloroflexota bacterium]
MSADQTDHHMPIEPIFTPPRRFFIASTILSYVIVFVAGMFFAWLLNDSVDLFFHQTSVSSSVFSSVSSPSVSAQKSYPAFLVSTPPAIPEAGLAYTAQTVFNDFRTTDRDVSGIIYSYGWQCCVTYQPEGKLIGWQETYGVELEIATFATTAEVKKDASDLLKNSVGYGVSTRNLCLFFYDSSISKAQLADYSAVLSRACS